MDNTLSFLGSDDPEDARSDTASFTLWPQPYEPYIRMLPYIYIYKSKVTHFYNLIKQYLILILII